MTNPFLQTVSNPQNSAIGVLEPSGKSSSNLKSGSEQAPAAFSDVLVKTQHVHQQNDPSSSNTSEAGLSSNTHIHEELQPLGEPTQLPGDGIPDPVFLGLALLEENIPSSQEQSVGLTHRAGETVPFTHPAVASQVSGKSTSQPHPSLLNTGVPLLPPTQPGFGATGGNVVQAGQPLVGLIPHEEAVEGHGGRLRPLLAVTPAPTSDLRAPAVSSLTTANQASINVQLADLPLGMAGERQEIVSATLVPNRANQVLEELSQTTNRIEQASKPSESIVTTQIGQAGLGGAGQDVPFGNQMGHGFTQLTDSSQGSQISTPQAQMTGRIGSFDERLQMLHSTPPQRLQIDVQLSETARVQVDVGVQQRNVYAGVLMDNPVLRNLALQNVQQLEDQLGQAEMDLQEFDVHGEQEQLGQQGTSERQNHEPTFSGMLDGKETLDQATRQGQSLVMNNHNPGWHFVA